MKTPRRFRKVACVGEVMIELVAGADNTARLGVAGDTFNTAVYLARLLRETGIDVSYVTALGTDAYSERIMAAMKGYGLSVDKVERRPGMMPGLYAIDTDEAGERSFSYWRSASAARTLFSEPCRIGMNCLDEFDLVFLSGITMAILPNSVRTRLMRWVDEFRAAGGTIAYDSNHRPALWEDDRTACEVNEAMWASADIALPSLDDEMALFGDRSEAAVIDRLRGYGLSRGALKRGANGPLNIADGSDLGDQKGIVRVVDSTAAGDSFNAGYLSAIVCGKTEKDAMLAGHQLALKVVSSPGAIVEQAIMGSAQ